MNIERFNRIVSFRVKDGDWMIGTLEEACLAANKCQSIPYVQNGNSVTRTENGKRHVYLFDSEREATLWMYGEIIKSINDGTAGVEVSFSVVEPVVTPVAIDVTGDEQLQTSTTEVNPADDDDQ